MRIELILPVVIFVESLTASVIYFCCGDMKHGFYWLFAAGVTAAATL